MPKKPNRYHALLEKIFSDRYEEGCEEVRFSRSDFVAAAKDLSIKLPKNLGDVIYSVRYRTSMPEAILKTEPESREWVIEGAGISEYAFRLTSRAKITASPHLIPIKIPDATPEIVIAHALSDEQAVLAKLRYNRLVDIFLGLSCYSLQNHLRTTVKGIGQIEIDEVYVGVDHRGAQYVVPVQAKSAGDTIGSVQTKQDIECCAQKFEGLLCRAVAAQSLRGGAVALFELAIADGDLGVINEKHYRLVPSAEITVEDLELYQTTRR